MGENHHRFAFERVLLEGHTEIMTVAKRKLRVGTPDPVVG